jgi:hypothetical protein
MDREDLRSFAYRLICQTLNMAQTWRQGSGDYDLEGGLWFVREAKGEERQILDRGT